MENKTLEDKYKELEDKYMALYEAHNRYGLRWNKELYPEDINVNVVLKEDKSRNIANSGVTHKLIEGENLHTLIALQKDYKGKIDVIEIDPPYNTGNNDFIYSDNFKSNKADFVDSEDGYRHTKWLNFMDRRLRLAKELMSDEGVIFIHIDDNEQANLKLLCDSIFGEMNFIGNFIWKSYRSKNNSLTVNNNYEYIICYSNNIDLVKANHDLFRVKKEGYDETMELLKQYIKDNKTPSEIEKGIKEFYKKNGYKGISMYNKVDSNFLIYQEISMDAPSQNGPRYDIVHPTTGKPCKIPANGWRFKEESMLLKIANNEVCFGKDETTIPRSKKLLTDVDMEVQQLVYENTKSGDYIIQDIFGSSAFDYSKPVDLIKYLLAGMKKDSIVLDFFAGSGTTGQAVIELNAEDNGTRQFILCTNNENGICENVTYQRLSKVINGYTGAKSGKTFDGYECSMNYYRVELIDSNKT